MFQGDELKDFLEKDVVKCTCYVREAPLGQATGALLEQYEDGIPTELEVGAVFGPGKYVLNVRYYFYEDDQATRVSKNKTYTYHISKKATFVDQDSQVNDSRLDKIEEAILRLSEKAAIPQAPPPQTDLLEVVKAVSAMSANNNNDSALSAILLNQTQGLMEDRRIEAKEAHSRAIEHSNVLAGGGEVAKKTIMDYVVEYAPMLKGMLFDPTGLSLKATKNKIKNDPEVIEMMQDEAQVAEAREGLKEFFPKAEDYNKIVDAFEGVKAEQEQEAVK